MAPGLQVRFLGASSVLFTDGTDTVVIDGFVSRHSVWRLATSRIGSDPVALDRHVRAHVRGRLAGVFIAHTHFDHALDAFDLARPPVRLFGSVDLQRMAGETDRVEVLRSGVEVALGEFTVTPIRTEHSAGDLAPGHITTVLNRPAYAWQFRGGENFAFLVTHGTCRILVVTSAGEPGDAFRRVRADVVLLSTGRLGNTDEPRMRRYWRDAVVPTGARLVVPIHWDDPTRSLDLPLAATPYLADRVDLAMATLTDMAGQQTAIRLPAAEVAMAFPSDYAPRCSD